MRATHLLIVIPLDPRVGDAPSRLDLVAAAEKELWSIFSAVRSDGFFHFDKMELHRKIGSGPAPMPNGPKVAAVHRGAGVGVFVAFKPSQLDQDLGLLVWAPAGWQVEAISRVIEWSQKATHDLLGRGFGGRMPYAELQDFM